MDMLNYDEFKQAVADNIKDYLPAKYEESHVEVKEVIKNNNTVLDGLVVTSPDSNVSPTIYLNHYYEQYKNGKDIDDVIGDIADVYIENAVDRRLDISGIIDFESAKEHIVPRIINAEENRELLADRPHQLMDDLAVTYHIQLNQEGTASIAVTDKLMEMYDISVEELHEIAVANLEEKMPTSFRTMADVMKEMIFTEALKEFDGDREAAMSMAEEMLPPGDDGLMYVLSNEQRLNGAAVALNEKAMEMVSEQIGGDFYVLPSSLHELLIVPKSAGMELSELESMVREVNATQVEPDEKLSDHVYAYDSREKELFRADRVEEHEKKVERKHEMSKNQEASKEHKRVSVKEKMSEMKEKAASMNLGKEKVPEKKKELALG